MTSKDKQQDSNWQKELAEASIDREKFRTFLLQKDILKMFLEELKRAAVAALATDLEKEEVGEEGIAPLATLKRFSRGCSLQWRDNLTELAVDLSSVIFAYPDNFPFSYLFYKKENLDFETEFPANLPDQIEGSLFLLAIKILFEEGEI